MQIVIEISKERYQDIQRIAEVQTEKRMLTCEQIIANGTPLPEHYGDLIDRNELLKQYGLENATKYGNKDAEQQRHSYSTMMMYEIADMIDDAETIIPATKEEKQSRNLTVLVVGDGRSPIREQIRDIFKQTATKEGDGE